MPKTNKTVATDASFGAYLDTIENEGRRADCETLMKMMERLSGEAPKMWGDSIVGFGEYHYKYDSGREGDFMRVGFSNRKANLTIYIMPGYQDFDEELSRLGKHKKGKSCLYIKRLSDVDVDVLEDMVAKGLRLMDEKYPRQP